MRVTGESPAEASNDSLHKTMYNLLWLTMWTNFLEEKPGTAAKQGEVFLRELIDRKYHDFGRETIVKLLIDYKCGWNFGQVEAVLGKKSIRPRCDINNNILIAFTSQRQLKCFENVNTTFARRRWDNFNWIASLKLQLLFYLRHPSVIIGMACRFMMLDRSIESKDFYVPFLMCVDKRTGRGRRRGDHSDEISARGEK